MTIINIRRQYWNTRTRDLHNAGFVPESRHTDEDGQRWVRWIHPSNPTVYWRRADGTTEYELAR